MREVNFEQGSLEWHRMRAGMVTGTSLKQALSKNWRTLMYELIAERMTEPEIDEFYSKSVERGKSMEPIALKKCIESKGIPYEPTGMLLSDEIEMFGISPDAIVRDGDTICGGLEIKCPSSKKHVEYLLKNKVPTEYFYQVLSPFVVSDDIQWWDFASYDDRNYERPLFHIRTEREDIKVEIAEARKKLFEFMSKVKAEHENLTF